MIIKWNYKLILKIILKNNKSQEGKLYLKD